MKYRSPLLWVLFHAVIGMVSAINSWPLVGYFYLFFLTSIPLVIRNQNVNSPLAFLIVYLCSFELLARMAHTSPYIPYELSKYLMFVLLIYGIVTTSGKGKVGLALILFLTPAMFYDLSDQVNFSDLRFNLLGPINVGLAIWFFRGLRFTKQGLHILLVALVLPLISSLAFTIYSSPDYDQFDFSLGGNFAVTGDFGPNQVSTAFGLGLFVSFYLWLNQMKLTGHRWMDIGLLCLFAFQGLISFSRGGMIGGILGILIVLFFLYVSRNYALRDYLVFRRAKKLVIPGVIVLLLSILAANMVTDGKLLLRYQGETEGTLQGSKEITLNTLTTNRLGILLADVDLFIESDFLGVGAGASQYMRDEYTGVLSHVESSRLIAEHGILGLVYIFIIFKLMFSIYRRKDNPMYISLLIAFIIIGWYTTFHAATRTYVSPLLIGLSLISIRESSSLPRK